MYCTLSTKASLVIRQPAKDAEKLENALLHDADATIEMISQADARRAEAWLPNDRDMVCLYLQYHRNHQSNKLTTNHNQTQ